MSASDELVTSHRDTIGLLNSILARATNAALITAPVHAYLVSDVAALVNFRAYDPAIAAAIRDKYDLPFRFAAEQRQSPAQFDATFHYDYLSKTTIDALLKTLGIFFLLSWLGRLVVHSGVATEYLRRAFLYVLWPILVVSVSVLTIHKVYGTLKRVLISPLNVFKLLLLLAAWAAVFLTHLILSSCNSRKMHSSKHWAY